MSVAVAKAGTPIKAYVVYLEKAVAEVPVSSVPAQKILTEEAVTELKKVPPLESVYYHLKT